MVLQCYNIPMKTKVRRLIPPEWYALRYAVLRRDKYTCRYCGQYAPNVQLEVDHIIPIAEGGSNELSNLQVTCFACNRGKANLWTIEKNGHEPKGIRPHPEEKPHTAHFILSALKKKSPQSVTELSQELQRPRGTIRTVLSRLRERGKVTATPSIETTKGRPLLLWRSVET